MGDTAREVELHLVVDQIANVLEHSGLSPLVGRLLGRLLTCAPPEQSSAELAEYCHASKGAISTATRMLMQMGLIERVRVRGDRAAYFRIAPAAWPRFIAGEVTRAQVMADLADRAVTLLSDRTAAERARIEEFRDLYRFFVSETPALIARWEASRRKK